MTTSGRTGCRGAAKFSLQIDIAKIVVHEADEPDAVVDFLDSEALAREHGRDIDFLAVQADAATGGDENVAIVQRIGEVRQAVVTL